MSADSKILKVQGTKAGHVRIEIGSESLSIPAADAGRIATIILDCAKDEGNPSAAPKSGDKIDWIPITPTTMSLGSGREPGQSSIVLAFGSALLGVLIDSKVLKQLGEAMIAASAEGRPQ